MIFYRILKRVQFYKRVASCIVIILFLSSGYAKCEEAYRRCLFVSVIQDSPVLSGSKNISDLIEFAKRSGINNLFVQVYFANKAWFSSDIADSGPYRKCLKSLSGDPLALLIREAHASGIEVHAWMNILSLGANKDAAFLKKYGTSILTKNIKEKNTLNDYKIDDQFFMEPGDPRIKEDLINIVGEVIRAYPDLDGIQFDYIRYPDKDPAYGFTDINVERFKRATGITKIDGNSQIWKDWKRDQVTGLLRALADKAHKLRPGIKVSATGCMPYSRALYEAFQDWPLWIEKGIVDYVTVMSYSPDPDEFGVTITKAKSKIADFGKVNIAIGAYKLTRLPGQFAQEFEITESSGAGGFAIFHYGSLLKNPALGDYLIETANKRRAR